jgi:hypothetical protein
VELALVFMMMAFIMPAAQGSGLPDDYLELVAAEKIPTLYRLTIILDAAVWLAIGGFLLTFAILLLKNQPLKGVLIAACGIAQVSGFTGALLRLEGTTRLAGSYPAAAPDQQAKILGSFLDLQTTINAHFDAGSWLYILGFLLITSIVRSLNGFPRWLAVLFGLVGLLNLANDSLAILTGQYQFVLFFLALLAEITTFFSTAVVFWRRPQKIAESMGLA